MIRAHLRGVGAIVRTAVRVAQQPRAGRTRSEGGGGRGIVGDQSDCALAHAPIKLLILESGAENFEAATQALYAGAETGVPYLRLDASRLRCLGGSSGHWGGWCRPLDAIDFEARDWLPYSGWPFGRKTLEPYFARAQSLVEAGPFIYDDAKVWTDSQGVPLRLGPGGVYTTYFQFSRQSEDVLPTNFGTRYADDLKRIPNLEVMLHANVTGLRLAAGAGHVDHLDVATLAGNRFTVNARHVVAAAGGIETARLLLASDDVVTAGIGNGRDLVGRFFADHPIPGQVATLVVFDGNLPVYYQIPREVDATLFRAALAPTDAFKRARHLLGSLTTIEGEIQLDALGQAAVWVASYLLYLLYTGAYVAYDVLPASIHGVHRWRSLLAVALPVAQVSAEKINESFDGAELNRHRIVDAENGAIEDVHPFVVAVEFLLHGLEQHAGFRELIALAAMFEVAAAKF